MKIQRLAELCSTGMAVALLASAMAVSGCGEQRTLTAGADGPTADRPAALPSSLVPADYEGRFRTRGTVLESPDHGPQLCHAMADSLPPQCGGPDVSGWDWSAVDAEALRGTRWGSYLLVGTFDGRTFTLTEPARADDGTRPAGDEADPSETPCPEPEGGWVPADPARATRAAFDAATQTAQTTEGFGGMWIDQRIPDDQLSEANANDPQVFVLNVTTTGSLAAMERAIRDGWGGSLCVTEAAHPLAELMEVQRQLRNVPGLLGSSIDERTGRIDVDVLVASKELQRDLDDRHGEATVVLHGALDPID